MRETKGGSGNNTGLQLSSGEADLGLHSSPFLPRQHSAFFSREVLDKDNSHSRDTKSLFCAIVLSTHFKVFSLSVVSG